MSIDADRPFAPLLLQQLLVTAGAALVCAYATASVVHFQTPIDDALPLVAVVLCVVAAVSSPEILVAVPLVAGGEIAVADERTRLLWFGAVIGVAFGAALISRPAAFWRSATLTVCAIVLLRWIPFANVRLPREIVLVLIAVAIVAALRSTAWGVATAVATALFTPLIPLRTLWMPLLVLFVAAAWPLVARQTTDRRQRSTVNTLGSAALALMLTLFAWSGALARAFPLAWTGFPQATPRATIAMALAPGQSAELDVPPEVRALIVSGANVSRLRRGTVVGRVDPGGLTLRIGDIADWGSLRREHYYTSRNGLPRNSAGLLRDYGYAAWVDGAARVPLPRAAVIHITADRALPPNARLQIESFELERR